MAYRRRYRRRRRYYRPRLRRRRARRDSLRRAVTKVRKVRKVGLDVQLQKLQKFRRNYYDFFELDDYNYYLNETSIGQTYGRSISFDFFQINNPRLWLGLWETAKNYKRVTNFYQKYTVYIRWTGLDYLPQHINQGDVRPDWRQLGLYVFMYPLGRNETLPDGILRHPLSRLAELPGCKVIHLKPPEYRGTQVRKMKYTLSRRNVHPKAGKDDNYDQVIYSRDGFDNFSMTTLFPAYDFRLQFVYMLDTPIAVATSTYPIIQITVKKKVYLKFSEPNYQDSVRFEGDYPPDPPGGDSME